MDWLLDRFFSPWGRIFAGVSALVASFFIWLAAHDHNIASATRGETLSQVSEGAKELNAKGLKARNTAERVPDALKRLRERYCSDC